MFIYIIFGLSSYLSTLRISLSNYTLLKEVRYYQLIPNTNKVFCVFGPDNIFFSDRSFNYFDHIDNTLFRNLTAKLVTFLDLKKPT